MLFIRNLPEADSAPPTSQATSPPFFGTTLYYNTRNGGKRKANKASEVSKEVWPRLGKRDVYGTTKGEKRRGEEGEEARARRRLIGQEIKLGLGEMARGERARARAREHTKYAISHAGVDKKNPFIAPLSFLSPSLPGVPALHAQHVDSWFRLPHTVVKQVPLPPSLQPLKFGPSRPRISSTKDPPQLRFVPSSQSSHC